MKDRTEKKSLLSVAFAIVVVLAAGIFLTTGDVRVSFFEHALIVDATYWGETELAYNALESVSYRENMDVGDRTRGLGSHRLSLGSFKNEALGAYTLYAYTDAAAHIILQTKDHTLAIGMRTAEETKALYDEIQKRIADSDETKPLI